MRPDVVVDVGNSRIKWGRCSAEAVVEAVSLPCADPGAWEAQIDRWGLPHPARWVVADVQPARRAQFAGWLRQRGEAVVLIEQARALPLRVRVEKPDHVGIDRLLDAVAANSRRGPGRAAVVIDAGSAVTVDLVDADGAFTGGAILPGLRLMARALHEHTALLPLIEVPRGIPDLPGKATIPAMEAGIYWAVAGGVRSLVCQYRELLGTAPEVFLTGGDAETLRPGLEDLVDHFWPAMTLEGMRLTAEAQP